MAIVNVIRGGWSYKCATPSEVPTWRVRHDNIVVSDLIETKSETLQIDTLELFETSTREEAIAKINELGLIFDPEVEEHE